MTPEKKLRNGLDALRKRYDARIHGSDPLAFPRRFAASDDREVVGLVASALAYGNVKSIANSLERVLTWMGPRPAERARTLDPREALAEFSGFRHRWSSGRDVVCLVYFAGQMISRFGSVGRFFEHSAVDGDMASSLSRFSTRALELDHGGLYRARRLPAKAGVRFFFTSPRTGACKRMNMYLRWMVREDDGLDLGIWQFMPARDLIIPLDTHIFRIGRHLGWSQRKTPGFRTAVEITEHLRRLDPEDPIKYDFALSRMGILENCPRHENADACELCGLMRRSS